MRSHICLVALTFSQGQSRKSVAVKQADSFYNWFYRNQIELSSENNMSELMTWSLCVTSPDDLPNLYLHLYSPSLISQIFKSLTWSRPGLTTNLHNNCNSLKLTGKFSIWTDFHRIVQNPNIYQISGLQRADMKISC